MSSPPTDVGNGFERSGLRGISDTEIVRTV
jgi:hypothetical protein